MAAPQGRNKHHLEYWVDYSVDRNCVELVGMRMPEKYVVEMFCDRVAASKNYNGDKYTDSFPLEYYLRADPDIICTLNLRICWRTC